MYVYRYIYKYFVEKLDQPNPTKMVWFFYAMNWWFGHFAKLAYSTYSGYSGKGKVIRWNNLKMEFN